MRRLPWMLPVLLCLWAAQAVAADKTIGVIVPGNMGYYQEAHKAFVAALAKEGFDYKAVDTLMQTPSSDPLSWANAARKMRVAEVNVMVIYSAPTALAALRDAPGIPLVFAAVYDPVGSGVTGGNVTGVASRVPVTSLLKYLKKLVPYSQLAVVYDELNPDSVRQAQDMALLEGKYGFHMVRLPLRKAGDGRNLEFTGKADAVIIAAGAVANEDLAFIVKSAHKAGLPTASLLGGSADQGVILTLAPSAAEQGETAARLTARILRGEKPSAIPTVSPQLVELILNLKEAGTLGIKPSGDLVSDATKVVK